MAESSLAVSVALCTRNGMPFIVEQLSSILHQSVPPRQLVVSDDASTDGTVTTVREQLARFRAERPDVALEVRIIENDPPLGVTANFEQAILACTGDIIVLSDQDDVWNEHRLARITEEFTEHPDLLLLHSDARLVDAAGAPLGESLSQGIGFSASEQGAVRDGRAFEVLLRRNVVTGATTAFRRSLVADAAPFPASWVHDEWLAMVAAVTGRVDFLPEQLVDYRQHGSNEIGAGTPSTADLWGRLREPRGERNARLLARSEALAERFTEPRVSAEVTSAVQQKRVHERVRSGLPRMRVLRLWPVLREWMSGRYSRYGRARYDVVRDLVQPSGR
ncbi:MAG TPA: glycosyltransferase family 2 protein [Terrimesophilobacter sp.]|nr:glycosyltransferase family 2 protein [Terrimesophilobacter sp.]